MIINPPKPENAYFINFEEIPIWAKKVFSRYIQIGRRIKTQIQAIIFLLVFSFNFVPLILSNA